MSEIAHLKGRFCFHIFYMAQNKKSLARERKFSSTFTLAQTSVISQSSYFFPIRLQLTQVPTLYQRKEGCFRLKPRTFGAAVACLVDLFPSIPLVQVLRSTASPLCINMAENNNATGGSNGFS